MNEVDHCILAIDLVIPLLFLIVFIEAIYIVKRARASVYDSRAI